MKRGILALGLAAVFGCTASGNGSGAQAASAQDGLRPVGPVDFAGLAAMVSWEYTGFPEPTGLNVTLSQGHLLWQIWDDASACVTAEPQDIEVRANGILLEMTDGGGVTRRSTVPGRGSERDVCQSLGFMIPALSPLPSDEDVTITLRSGERRASIEIPGFGRPRVIELEGGAVRAGERVSLHWRPADDEWDGGKASPSVTVRPQVGPAPRRIETGNGLRVEPPEFSFVMPRRSRAKSNSRCPFSACGRRPALRVAQAFGAVTPPCADRATLSE
ncbi:MAG: hypothetical protein JKY37_16630 [Nannocystaceae bacterium]|nr:hypothetical protein [Nannocystaceae bacterium]